MGKRGSPNASTFRGIKYRNGVRPQIYRDAFVARMSFARPTMEHPEAGFAIEHITVARILHTPNHSGDQAFRRARYLPNS